MKADPRTFRWHDTSLRVRAPGEGKDTIHLPDGRRIEAHWNKPDWTLWADLLRVLKGLGFSIEDDARINQHYPSLRATHREGRRGDLRWFGETYPAGCEVKFYQELVTENPNGGRYDFDRLAKMPYPVRLGFERARRALTARLLDLGLVETSKVESPNPDPLAYFNDGWDSEHEKRRGTHRFERDETGWPSARELRCWNQADRDGVPLTHGAVRYARDLKGYLRRGRVYGGINGMWMFVYGPGRRDYTHAHATEFFAWKPGLPRKVYPRAGNRLERLLGQAVKAQDFEHAIRLRDALRRLTTTTEERNAA